MWKVIALVLAASSAQAEPLKLSVMEGTSLPPIDMEQHACLTEALFWEARNQPIDGNYAVGYVIANRANHEDFPDSICEVVHQGPRNGSAISLHKCQFSYYCDGKGDNVPNDIVEQWAWEMADIYAEDIMRGTAEDKTKGSTHYHADYVTKPNWAKVYTLVAVVGVHLFYQH